MKRFALCIVLIALTQFRTLAFDNRSSIGLEFGSNIATIKGSTPLHSLRKTIRSTFGISYQYNFNKKISLKSGLLYDCKGAKAQNTIFYLDTTGTSLGEVTPYINYNYLTVPILFQYSYGNKIKVFSVIGPYLSYLLNRKDIVRGDNTSPLVVYEGKHFDNSLDVGGILNTGVAFKTSKKISCTLEARQFIGVANILKVKSVDMNDARHSATVILIGMKFSF